MQLKQSLYSKLRLQRVPMDVQAVSIGVTVDGEAADSSVYLPLSLPRAASRPLALLSTIFLRSLSIFSLTMTTCKVK